MRKRPAFRRYLAAIALILLVFGIADAAERVPMGDILAHPQQYQNQRVETKGILVYTSAGVLLYPDQRHYDAMAFRGLIKISLKDLLTGESPKLPVDHLFAMQGQCVAVTGYIDAKWADAVGGGVNLNSVNLNDTYTLFKKRRLRCPRRM